MDPTDSNEKNRSERRRYNRLTSFEEVFNYLLATYAADSHISAANVEINRLTQLPDQPPPNFAIVNFQKATRCGRVKYQTALSGIFLE